MYHLIDYVWCVDKFSQYLKDGNEHEVYPLLTSPIFSYKNTSWVLNLYPEGLGDQASHGYISLFIKYVSEDPETINARVELSLLNTKNERVYCRDTGDHQYQTFIDFGYKQFLKIADIKEQRADLLINASSLKIFARVEFESTNLQSSLTWTNYDLLLFKEHVKDLYESQNLCDIIIKVVKRTSNFSKQPDLNDLSKSSLGSLNYMNRSQKQTGNLLSSSPHSFYNSNDFDAQTGNKFSFLPQDDFSFPKAEETLEIKSHKFILASRSVKFKDLLKTNLIKLNRSNKPTLASECSKCCQKQSMFSSPKTKLVTSFEEPINYSEPSSSSYASSASSACTSATACSSASFTCDFKNEDTPSTSYSSDDSLLCTCTNLNDTFSSSMQSNSSSQWNPSTSMEANEQINDMLIIETDRSPKVIELLIRYMYSCYLESLDTYAKDVYEISKEYKVHGLTNLARDHIIKELNHSNCCDYLVFSVVNNDYELNNKIQSFIGRNNEIILKTNEYKQAKRKYRELFENTFNEITKCQKK